MKEQLIRRVSLGGQGGFGIVEVMVTAFVVLLVTVATVASITTSQQASGANQARAVIANLAEQDQERMRSMRATDLVNFSEVRPVTAGGVPYTVTSSAELVQDEGGTAVTCTSTGEQPRYLRLKTVTTPGPGSKARAQTIDSIYALPIAQFSPTSGTLIVKVAKADGLAPQPTIPVTISGPAPGTGTKNASTNSAGCAIFQFLDPGSYSVSVNKASYVDPTGTQAVVLSGTVTPGNVNETTTLLYDLAGRINLSIDRKRDSGSAATVTPTTRSFSLSNSGPPSVLRTSTAPTASGLFPFPTAAYGAYLGTCTANDPSQYDPNYFANRPGYGAQVVAPGGNHNVTVRAPAVKTAISLNGSGTPAGLTVKLTQTDAGCGAPTFFTTTRSDGSLNEFAYPYGTYTVCAQWTESGNNPRTWHQLVTGVRNTAFDGVTAPAFTVPNSGSTRRTACP